MWVGWCSFEEHVDVRHCGGQISEQLHTQIVIFRGRHGVSERKGYRSAGLLCQVTDVIENYSQLRRVQSGPKC